MSREDGTDNGNQKWAKGMVRGSAKKLAKKEPASAAASCAA